MKPFAKIVSLSLIVLFAPGPPIDALLVNRILLDRTPRRHRIAVSSNDKIVAHRSCRQRNRAVPRLYHEHDQRPLLKCACDIVFNCL